MEANTEGQELERLTSNEFGVEFEHRDFLASQIQSVLVLSLFSHGLPVAGASEVAMSSSRPHTHVLESDVGVEVDECMGGTQTSCAVTVLATVRLAISFRGMPKARQAVGIMLLIC